MATWGPLMASKKGAQNRTYFCRPWLLDTPVCAFLVKLGVVYIHTQTLTLAGIVIMLELVLIPS